MRKNRIPKERTIYSNYSLWGTYPDEEVIEMLVENGTDKEEISDETIWKERYFLDEIDWEDTKISLKEFFEGSKWILFGSVGRWNGVRDVGFIFETFEEFFYKATEDCPYWHFYDENGHMYLRCSHHDGSCLYEIKELTDKGKQYLENWEDNWNDKRSEEHVHTQIINKYSRVPRYAEKQWGCKRFEYQPVTKESLIDIVNRQARSFYC